MSGHFQPAGFSAIFFVTLLCLGCSQPNEESISEPETNTGDVGGVTNAQDHATKPSLLDAVANKRPSAPSDPGAEELPPAPGEAEEMTSQKPAPGLNFHLADDVPNAPTDDQNDDLAGDLNRRQLRQDFTPQELIDWLQYCDLDMEAVGRGKTQLKDPVEISRMLEAIARKKLEGSLQLKNHADATETQKIAGLRGQLQSLSHLASMGDLPSAKALKTLAESNLDSEIPSVAGDSRIILIGFALDELAGGRDEAADELVELVNSMQPKSQADIPAVLMLAEARRTLADYGMIDQAAKVRERILTLYGESTDPTISQIAADAAGTAKFDRARRLLDAILDNDEVAIERWTDAVNELLNDSPDIFAVQFLLEATLHLEVFGRDNFVKETFRLLSENITDEDSTIAKEVATAKEAMQARRDVIGTTFDFENYPVVVDQTLTPVDYEDKIVLMPFWVMQFPGSLQILPLLQKVQSSAPDRISIVGMNLDPAEAPVREFIASNQITFPNFRSVSSGNGEVANPIAAEFGLVSMPFVAVIDPGGKVAAIDFSGMRLESIVKELLAK
ncbi:TlpA family protein disulfide reductase [Roseiconus lacunae]|uniref:TlpA family protein disulfide reductase n=1 Tax=Roseiconus lacunae TaxID=2605694 RepID=UPI001E44456E|nr:TlpA disulfide reductase family protein [Roseiconus lacunae]MCD0462547.1 TlpA family protein disulfide reductase [Roseiconus lacunae]